MELRRRMLNAKIHRATVTDANLHYIGSITVDIGLMEAADLRPFELVAVVDVTNGARLETYVIEGERDSGVVCVNGAGAHLIDTADLVIIMSFVDLDERELDQHQPTVVHVDANNSVVDEPASAYLLRPEEVGGR